MHPRKAERLQMTRKLILLATLILALGVISGGIAIAAGGGAGPQAGTTTVETGEDESGKAENGEGAKAENGNGGQAEDESGEQSESDESGETSESSDSEERLTDPAAKKAADAAVAATGGGTVTSVERDDGDAGYEVEIRKADGSEAQVQLDTSFKVRQTTGDDD
jgi:uncharacterized membrane protein YkoI